MEGPRSALDDFDPAMHDERRLAASRWRRQPPVLRSAAVMLRELRLADAPALLAMVQPHDLVPIVAPAAPTVEGLAEHIELARDERSRGLALTLGVIPQGYAAPVGAFRVRQTEPGFGCAEWTFAIGRAFWGAGVFLCAAPLVADFVFDVLGARRLEARVSVRNGRGSGAMAKLGAVQEALMRGALREGDEPVDLVLWAIVAEEWRRRRPSPAGQVH
jgi:RimJ/RimL family protein N-acetyltransferase